MEKINAVLVLLKRGALDETLKKLNLDKINLVTIIADGDERIFRCGDKEIPRTAFSTFPKTAKKFKDFVWLIGGYVNGVDDLDRMKNFLMTVGVPEDNIVNLEVTVQMSGTWLANLRYVEEHGADFFATGNEFMRDGLNMKYIPCVHVDKKISRGGVNLADARQDLRQSFLTARHVFAYVKRGTIKFVLIGLAPDSFYYDNAKDFAHQKNLQYVFALNLAEENSSELLLFSDDVKNFFPTLDATPDLNFDALKTELNREFSAQAIADWNDDKKNLTPDATEANFQILKDYIELCLANGAKPVGVVFPSSPAEKKIYSEEQLKNFRATIHRLEENYDFECVDMSELNLGCDCFCDTTNLNLRGMTFANALLSLKLNAKNLIPTENFCDMTYDYFDCLSYVSPKDEYNELMARVFKKSAERIRGKDKIKVGFVLYDSSMWCGDDLYNFCAADEKFETTVFLFKIPKAGRNEAVEDDFQRGVEQFKAHGLNVVPVERAKAPLPPQDVLFLLIPYPENVPNAFQLSNVTTKTLVAHIIYSLAVSVRTKGYYNRRIFHTAWKIFFPSIINLKLYGKNNIVGMPRGFVSGYPRIDAFFKKNSAFHFDWKLARPDAKKIIWAPHHSIPSKGVHFATFQWNYKFMYEFAKAHPEISWVVKPHPALAYRAIAAKIFPSDKAFKDYLQAWNDLPNAQVYTGAYYQDLFATSDGMIHDSGSFTAEYQYVDKPMIFLTREGTNFNELGNEIFKVSYLVDGKDLDAIAATIQKVFIEGDDFKAAARKKIFDKYLNYPKTNGMLASEFIYRSVADALKA